MANVSLFQITCGIEKNKDNKDLTPDVVSKGLNQSRELISRTFGGYTEMDSNGGWINPDNGKLVVEKGKTFMVVCPNDALDNYVESVASFMCKALDQHSVLLVKKGIPSFIDQSLANDINNGV